MTAIVIQSLERRKRKLTIFKKKRKQRKKKLSPKQEYANSFESPRGVGGARDAMLLI